MRSRRPEDIVAAVNALVVLLLPFIIWAIVSTFSSPMDAPVRPQRSFFENALRSLVGLVPIIGALAPGSLVAGWRSWVHAHRALKRGRFGWLGVVEAAACGFGRCFLVVGSRVLTRAAFGPPQQVAVWVYVAYPAFYGALAALVGFAIGVVLQLTGMVTLRACVGSLTRQAGDL